MANTYIQINEPTEEKVKQGDFFLFAPKSPKDPKTILGIMRAVHADSFHFLEISTMQVFHGPFSSPENGLNELLAHGTLTPIKRVEINCEF